MSYAHGTMFVAKCASESDRMHTHHTAAIKKTSPNHHHTADIKKTTMNFAMTELLDKQRVVPIYI